LPSRREEAEVPEELRVHDVVREELGVDLAVVRWRRGARGSGRGLTPGSVGPAATRFRRGSPRQQEDQGDGKGENDDAA
jgi:hypothetical protein